MREKKKINKDFEYNRKTDMLPGYVTVIIIVVSIVVALYLGIFVAV